MVKSNFPTARRHLEDAFRLISGEDELSEKSRQALEILIDAFLAAEFSTDKRPDNVVEFDTRRRRSAR
jgi:hypothetical protein